MTCKGGIAGTKVAEGNSRREGGNSKCSSGEGGLTAVAVSGTPEEDEDFEADPLTPLTVVAGCDTTEEAEDLETDVPLDTKEKGKGLDAEAATE